MLRLQKILKIIKSAPRISRSEGSTLKRNGARALLTTDQRTALIQGTLPPPPELPLVSTQPLCKSRRPRPACTAGIPAPAITQSHPFTTAAPSTAQLQPHCALPAISPPVLPSLELHMLKNIYVIFLIFNCLKVTLAKTSERLRLAADKAQPSRSATERGEQEQEAL